MPGTKISGTSVVTIGGGTGTTGTPATTDPNGPINVIPPSGDIKEPITPVTPTTDVSAPIFTGTTDTADKKEGVVTTGELEVAPPAETPIAPTTDVNAPIFTGTTDTADKKEGVVTTGELEVVAPAETPIAPTTDVSTPIFTGTTDTAVEPEGKVYIDYSNMGFGDTPVGSDSTIKIGGTEYYPGDSLYTLAKVAPWSLEGKTSAELAALAAKEKAAQDKAERDSTPNQIITAPTHTTAWGTVKAEPLYGTEQYPILNPTSTFKDMADARAKIGELINNIPVLGQVDDAFNYIAENYHKGPDWFDQNLFNGAGKIVEDLGRIFIPYANQVALMTGASNYEADPNDPWYLKGLIKVNNSLRNVPIFGGAISLIEDMGRAAYFGIENLLDPYNLDKMAQIRKSQDEGDLETAKQISDQIAAEGEAIGEAIPSDEGLDTPIIPDIQVDEEGNLVEPLEEVSPIAEVREIPTELVQAANQAIEFTPEELSVFDKYRLNPDDPAQIEAFLSEGNINATRNDLIDRYIEAAGPATSGSGVGSFADALNTRGQITGDLGGDIGYVPHNPGDSDTAGQLAYGVPVAPFDLLREFSQDVNTLQTSLDKAQQREELGLQDEENAIGPSVLDPTDPYSASLSSRIQDAQNTAYRVYNELIAEGTDPNTAAEIAFTVQPNLTLEERTAQKQMENFEPTLPEIPEPEIPEFKIAQPTPIDPTLQSATDKANIDNLRTLYADTGLLDTIAGVSRSLYPDDETFAISNDEAGLKKMYALLQQNPQALQEMVQMAKEVKPIIDQVDNNTQLRTILEKMGMPRDNLLIKLLSGEKQDALKILDQANKIWSGQYVPGAINPETEGSIADNYSPYEYYGEPTDYNMANWVPSLLTGVEFNSDRFKADSYIEGLDGDPSRFYGPGDPRNTGIYAEEVTPSINQPYSTQSLTTDQVNNYLNSTAPTQPAPTQPSDRWARGVNIDGQTFYNYGDYQNYVAGVQEREAQNEADYQAALAANKPAAMDAIQKTIMNSDSFSILGDLTAHTGLSGLPVMTSNGQRINSFAGMNNDQIKEALYRAYIEDPSTLDTLRQQAKNIQPILEDLNRPAMSDGTTKMDLLAAGGLTYDQILNLYTNYANGDVNALLKMITPTLEIVQQQIFDYEQSQMNTGWQPGWGQWDVGESGMYDPNYSMAGWVPSTLTGVEFQPQVKGIVTVGDLEVLNKASGGEIESYREGGVAGLSDGEFVIPADVVSGLGNGSTKAGARKIYEFLGESPIDPFGEGGETGYYKVGGQLLDGPGDGMSDSIPAMITGNEPQPAALADGEFVVSNDQVARIGGGSAKVGARKLYQLMDNVRKDRTGTTKQAPQINADKHLNRLVRGR